MHTFVDGSHINGPSEKKRVTRSSPTKNENYLLVENPDQSPSVHGLTTILLTPSKKKSPMTRQQTASEVAMATKSINRSPQRLPESTCNNTPENLGNGIVVLLFSMIFISIFSAPFMRNRGFLHGRLVNKSDW